MPVASDILLSICIPTFRRDKFIEPLLASIPETFADQIEVCISENPCPGDTTEEIVNRFRPRFTHFKYEKRDRNYGFEDNLQHVIKMSQGKYCWTVGSDDRITPDALETILTIIKDESPGILICGRITTTLNGDKQTKQSYLPPEIESFRFVFSENDKIRQYLHQAQLICAQGAFISANIFERELWLTANARQDIAKEYIHMNVLNAILFSPQNRDKKFIYIKKPVTVATLENDAIYFGEWTANYRLFIDLKSITEIADTYITDPKIRKEFIHVLRRQHRLSDLYRTAVIPFCNKEEMRLLKRIFPLWKVWICRYLGYRRDGILHKILKRSKRFLFSLRSP